MKRFTTTVLVLALTVGGTSACDSIFEISNPGPIPDEALNDPSAFQGLVTGMSADLSVAVDEIYHYGATMSGELRSTGFTAARLAISRGTMLPTDANGVWADGQRARWVAEDGIRRMEEDGHESTALARAYLLAGYANRILGENFCQAVFDGGPAQPHTAFFERAAEHFETARSLAATHDDPEVETAAVGGRASVLAALGQWDQAASLGETVPLDFRYDAIFSTNSSRETSNSLIYYGLQHSEGTVFGTEWAEVEDDLRVPWEVALDAGGEPRLGRDSETPWWRPLKYTSLSDDIALTKGTEMALIQAETALRAGDLDEMVTQLNRARGHHGMDPLDPVATEDEAWELLKRERGAELWLEGRRFWDRRRWFAEGRDEYIAGHDSKCMPVSQNEIDTNQNLP